MKYNKGKKKMIRDRRFRNRDLSGRKQVRAANASEFLVNALRSDGYKFQNFGKYFFDIANEIERKGLTPDLELEVSRFLDEVEHLKASRTIKAFDNLNIEK